MLSKSDYLSPPHPPLTIKRWCLISLPCTHIYHTMKWFKMEGSKPWCKLLHKEKDALSWCKGMKRSGNCLVPWVGPDSLYEIISWCLNKGSRSDILTYSPKRLNAFFFLFHIPSEHVDCCITTYCIDRDRWSNGLLSEEDEEIQLAIDRHQRYPICYNTLWVMHSSGDPSYMYQSRWWSYLFPVFVRVQCDPYHSCFL